MSREFGLDWKEKMTYSRAEDFMLIMAIKNSLETAKVSGIQNNQLGHGGNRRNTKS